MNNVAGITVGSGCAKYNLIKYYISFGLLLCIFSHYVFTIKYCDGSGTNSLIVVKLFLQCVWPFSDAGILRGVFKGEMGD